MFSMGYRSDSKRAQPTLEPGRVPFPTRTRLRRVVSARDVSVDMDSCYAACERVFHLELEGKDVQVQFVDQPALNTDSPHGEFMLTILGAMAQLERATIRERQAEGIALARARGSTTGPQNCRPTRSSWKVGGVAASRPLRQARHRLSCQGQTLGDFPCAGLSNGAR